MKADLKKMFSVPLKNMKPEDGAPFPIYIFLRRSDRFIPIRLQNDPLGAEKYHRFLDKNHHEIWVPNDFQDVYKQYLDYLEKTGHPIQTLAEVAALANAPSAATAAQTQEVKSEEAQIVKDVYEDKDLSTDEKAKILSAVSQDLLRSLNQITDRGEEARKEGVKRCKQIADEILMVASQDSNIYDEILALRNSQEDIEHSVIVGTIAVMFSMAISLIDEKLLADLTIASIFHDIGLVKLKGNILHKAEKTWNAAERKEYESHVQASIDILKESETEFHPRVFRIIKEHHENYDGSGFPNKLKGVQIDELSQITHLANLFDRLCTGKQTGTKLSPSESFDYIYEISRNPAAVQEVQPELVERIFQFMLTEKEATDALKADASSRAKEAVAELSPKNNN